MGGDEVPTSSDPNRLSEPIPIITTSDTSQDGASTTLLNTNPSPSVPPRKISRPKITLQMPRPISIASALPPQFYTTPGGIVNIPITPATGAPINYPFTTTFQMYPNKAQEFMFKQFEGFKDVTKKTGKLGLSFGEKFSFWLYGKVKGLSSNGFTHIFLLIVTCLYCILGGLLFYACENKERSLMSEANRHRDEKKLNYAVSRILKLFRDHQITAKLNHSVYPIITDLQQHYFDSYNLDDKRGGWNLISSMYFCGTIFTTIVGILAIFITTTLANRAEVNIPII